MKKLLTVLVLFFSLTARSQTVGPFYITTAQRDGKVDAAPQLQADVDYCIANNITTLIWLKGTYKLSKPIIIYKNNSLGGYGQVTLRIIGEGGMWDSYATTVIQTDFTDQFAIGVQQGKGVTIEGLTIIGKYNPKVVDDKTFYNRELKDCTDSVCRQTRFSPNAGIAIDPFTNGQMPSDGGYPGLTTWYKGNGSNAGSTAITINKCTISSFPVGIVSSPNGYTQNAEITTISNTKFANCPLWISGGQAQEKQNRIINVAGWVETHTVFATGVYGAAQPGNWDMDGVNVAGRCNRIINNPQGGFYPTNINKVFAEGLGKFGFIGGVLGCGVSNSTFHFVPVSVSGYKKDYIAGENVTFNNCVFRHYGYSYPIPIQTRNSRFVNCYFSGLPYKNTSSGDQSMVNQFENCSVGGSKFGMRGNVSAYISYSTRALTYGDYTVEETEMLRFGIHYKLKNVSHETFANITKDVNVSIDTNVTSFSFLSVSPSIYQLNSGVYLSNTKDGNIYIFGQVTSILENIVTISYCPSGLIGGTYKIATIYPISLGTFMGDITAGSNLITNVRKGWGSYSLGMVFQSTYSGYTRWLRITGISGSTYTVSENMTSTKAGAYFGSNTTQEISSENPSLNILSYLSNFIVNKGDKINQGGSADNSINYVVTKSGLVICPPGDTTQATWILAP